MDFYASTQPVHGLERLKEAVQHYLNTDVEALDRKVISSVNTEFAELEVRLRGLLVSVKDSLSDREFERRAEQVFDVHFEHIQAGEDPMGLLPEIRKGLSAFMDLEMSEGQRLARAERADVRIGQIRADLLHRLTPEEAEAKRRQMPSPGLMNETAVEIEMRKQMRERVAARIAGLGEDFSQHCARQRRADADRDVRQGLLRGRAPRGAAPAGQGADRAHRRARAIRPRLRERGALPEQRDGQGRRGLRGALALLRAADRGHPRRDRPRRSRDPRARDARARAVLRDGDRRQSAGDAERGSRRRRERDAGIGQGQARLRRGLSGGEGAPAAAPIGGFPTAGGAVPTPVAKPIRRRRRARRG